MLTSEEPLFFLIHSSVHNSCATILCLLQGDVCCTVFTLNIISRALNLDSVTVLVCNITYHALSLLLLIVSLSTAVDNGGVC